MDYQSVMDISSLMVSTFTRVEAIRGRFPGGKVTNLLFNYFDGSNEGLTGREAEMKGSM